VLENLISANLYILKFSPHLIEKPTFMKTKRVGFLSGEFNKMPFAFTLIFRGNLPEL